MGSAAVYTAINPLIQLFKPVSPLAWLPLVTMVVSATYSVEDPLFHKSFLNSAITVALCCLWPTLINTTVGVARLTRTWSMSVGYGACRPGACAQDCDARGHAHDLHRPAPVAGHWLDGADRRGDAGAEPGLGKFVWDEFQNGSSNSLGRIMVAVLVIGLIGFCWTSCMLTLQRQ